ncbi:hypothetical protein LX15_003345 [Streptoalloteichus tenebrarius]|uniref:Uncharacterized protein n=1 Tax=Streptoalloteichus tenebrarius (strain ATCC 17920 / DSM 40477 / JCM 4838 / CBS 697.72 / NBRC 16177 / NCIMB 11028 / NRRL B-12390 / A12253. 1 / ISP 5477) TaxID=1933 RepID=A0ABT1HW46_STRSD|nr:hypothetical protein [Streptoalloteichus tenebrarius]MCP2259640.1 hypothetical protein [Streptoalloteichus tenebrarius]
MVNTLMRLTPGHLLPGASGVNDVPQVIEQGQLWAQRSEQYAARQRFVAIVPTVLLPTTAGADLPSVTVRRPSRALETSP